MRRLLPLTVLAFAAIIAAVVSAGPPVSRDAEWMPNLTMPLVEGPASEPLGCPTAFTRDCPCQRPGGSALLAASPDCPCRTVQGQGSGPDFPGGSLALVAGQRCSRCGCPGAGHSDQGGQNGQGGQGGQGAGPGTQGPQSGGTAEPRCPRCKMKLADLPLDDIRKSNPARHQNLAAIERLRGQCLKAMPSQKTKLVKQMQPLVARELRYQQEDNKRQVTQMEERLNQARELNRVREVKWEEIVTNASRQIAGLEPTER